MSKIIRTVVVSLLAVTLLGGPALADPKDKQPPGQAKKAEKQETKEDRMAEKAAEKADKQEAKAAEKAEEAKPPKEPKAPKAPKNEKKPKKDVIPGNNGTIKADGERFDLSYGNEPHVGCTFRINSFNFDGVTKTSTVTIEGQAPTGGGVFLVDAVTSTGSDASSPVYSLSSFDQAALATATPHPKQGYHVKVTTSTPYSNGNDTKSKVFWIDCPLTTPEADAAPRAPGSRDIESIELAPMEVESNESDTQVLGARITRPQAAQPAEAQGTQVLGLTLPFTGRSIVIILLAGLALLFAGAVVVNRSRA